MALFTTGLPTVEKRMGGGGKMHMWRFFILTVLTVVTLITLRKQGSLNFSFIRNAPKIGEDFEVSSKECSSDLLSSNAVSIACMTRALERT